MFPNQMISIVIPSYNEERNVTQLVDKIVSAMNGTHFSYEIIFVDDGSSDTTAETIKKIRNKNIVLIELRKNYGQSTALMAGIDYAGGDYIVTMDGDLQNDPADIPKMLSKAWQGDWDLVAGIRATRKDNMLLRKVPSKLANMLIRKLSGVNIDDYGCTLKVFRREIAKELGLYGELHRFIPILASFQGASITQMEVMHHARIHGKSKYGLNRIFKVMVDLLLMLFIKKYQNKPMHLFGVWGLFLFLAGIIINLVLLAMKIAGNDIWGRPLLMLGVMLTLGGIQLITFGLMSEIQMRTYYEAQNKKTYRIKKVTLNESQSNYKSRTEGNTLLTGAVLR